MIRTKSFPITKRQVWEAWKKVKANRGGAGVDGQTVTDFVGDNLYKLWNRMASGSYHPSPVRRVEIPKEDGGVRPLGIPTVADRVAQMVVKEALEPELEKHFHPDSYGYRPGKSAHQALAQTRKRCWRIDWVLDLDIKSFFDTIDHDLLLRAVRHHTDETWMVLYIERWLKAPVMMPDGKVHDRDRGTPQGGVASPLLANLFLHYTFDKWMGRNYPDIPFERYAMPSATLSHEAAVGSCSFAERALARMFNATIRGWMNFYKKDAETLAWNAASEDCGLTLHPQKTRIVYCKDSDRQRSYPDTSFDFLGYTFRPRRSKNRWGKFFVNFSPAISNKAAKAIRREIRSWKLQLRSDKSFDDLARMYNATIRGWINYYGAFYKSALFAPLRMIDRRLALWATRKMKRLRGHRRRAALWVADCVRRDPNLFAHWRVIYRTAA